MTFKKWLRKARQGHGALIRDDSLARRAYGNGMDPREFAEVVAGGFLLSPRDRTRGRHYRVIWKRDDKATRGILAPGPFTHKEAITVASKVTKHPWRRVLLEEIVSRSPRHLPRHKRIQGWYFTVLIPWVGYQATKWHPTEGTGPFKTLSRGAFKTRAEATTWADSHLAGHPYRVQRHDTPYTQKSLRAVHASGRSLWRSSPRKKSLLSRPRALLRELRKTITVAVRSYAGRYQR